MALTYKAYVDGRWVDPGRRFEVRDPFDGAVIAEVAACDDAVVDAAIASAARAFPAWRTRPGPERGKLLSQVAQRMLANERRLAELCKRENGKPIAESVAEVRYAASFLSWFAGEDERIYGRFVAQIARLRIGRGSDEGTDLGPVIDDGAVAKLQKLIGDRFGDA